MHSISEAIQPIDTSSFPPNNADMTKPETVRRIKAYSAESGYVYQYQFQDVHPAEKEGAAGNEYIYYVSADRKTMFPVRIFVRRDALDNWTKKDGTSVDRNRRVRGGKNAAISSARRSGRFCY